MKLIPLLCVIASAAYGLGWSGKVDGTEVAVTFRPADRNFPHGAFVLYTKLYQVRSGPLILRCGVAETGLHSSSFCADDLNKYSSEIKVSAGSRYNIVLSIPTSPGMPKQLFCSAANEQTPLFCVPQGLRKPPYKLDPVGY